MLASVLRTALRVLAALLVVAVLACARTPALPPPDPEVDATSQAFLAALKAGDLGIGAYFADRVVVIGELKFVGGSGRGRKEVSRQELIVAYARLFDGLRSQGWARVMESRRPLINIALHDGHHAEYAKAGDYVFELGRPDTQEYQPIYVFVFRKVAGKYLIVMHAADY